MKKIKIAFVTASNPLDKESWSGIYFQMQKALKDNGQNVDCIGPIPVVFSKSLALINRITRFVFRKGYNYKNSFLLSYVHSKYIQFKLLRKKYDYIFAPTASTEIAFLNTKIPIIYCSDSSFGQMNEYYDTYSNLFPFSVKESNKVEQKAIKKAKFITYPSNWAKDYVERNYSTKAKIEVIPFGANIDDEYVEFLPKTISKTTTIHIFFLGVDWHRKGGELVYETFLKLLEKGYDIHLTVCGCTPSIKHQKMEVIPFLNKNKESDLNKLSALFKRSHFLFLPSNAECFGIVFCEASAYGVPSITRNTGGISNAVYDGLNGFCLDVNATSDNYCELFENYIENPEIYSKLSLSSRNLYIEKLNWKSWVNELLNSIEIEKKKS